MKQAASQNVSTQATCLLRQSDGVFVDLSKAGVGFSGVIDKLFSEGVRFRGLDYGLLMNLLYDYEQLVAQHGTAGKLKLAEDFTTFTAERRALYKAVKIDSAKQSAEYFFEPVFMEVVTEEVMYGAQGEDGVAPVISSSRKAELRPTRLDPDEFIADMWLKGVRFGINVAAVSGVISRGETMRMDVAFQRDATPGMDAKIEDVCDVLHRDNAPKLLANGKADLRKFQNRFPQIKSGVRLLKKKSRIFGKQGIRVDGQRIEPLEPKDNIDLHAMSGPGTYVETQEGNEYILAAQDGFLSLNDATGVISVTEMIENKGGISIKTTGDLSLAGNDFIEHGEVQEGRVVEGKNMTFRSNVYGHVVSQSGYILLEANLSGGSAKSHGGDITSNGRVFNAVVEARTGKVTLKYAESCLILGASVVIERAVNCEIIAENVQVGSAEGCSIAGQWVQINLSSACREKETLVSMVVPDFSSFDAQLARIDNAIDECNKTVEAKDQEMAVIKSDAEFAKYLALGANIRQGKLQLNAAQQDAWKKLVAKFAPAMSNGKKLNEQKQEQLTQVKTLQQERASLLDERKKTSKGIHCEIKEIAGDTLVRTMVAQIAALQKSGASEIKAKLREQDTRHQRIFSNDTGSLVWSLSVNQ